MARLSLALLMGCACTASVRAPPVRSCQSVVRFAPAQSIGSASIAGEWASFSAEPMVRLEDGSWSWVGTLEPRDYAYRFELPGDQVALDERNAFRRWVGGTEYSRLTVPDCRAPLLEVSSFVAGADGRLQVAVQASRGSTGATLAAPVVALDDQLLVGPVFDELSGQLTVSRDALPVGKHHLTIELADQKGRAAERQYLPFWVEASPFHWDGALLYFTFTDRFRNGSPANDAPVPQVPALANYAGGDFAGITAAIEEGYFDRLGVTALWLSPLDANPDGAFAGSQGQKYTGYHGYWPSKTREPQRRFGTLAELQQLTAAAHRRGIRVIADLVLNHTHQEHPYFVAHKNEGWFHLAGSCVCADQGCGFDARRLDCWFASYLPDLDWTNPAMAQQVTADALWWLEQADLDGFRLDAIKHLEHLGGRNIKGSLQAITDATGTGFYLVGETFTGSDGRAQIAEYLGPLELDGQFDFPLYWPVIDAFAKGGSLKLVDEAVKANEAFYPAGTVNAPFLGNHDVARFISQAAGQIEADPSAQAWNNPPPAIVTDDAAFARAALAFTFLLTQSGVPLIYYGDEIGLPGAGDPDNRRLMKWSGLTAAEERLRSTVAALGTARRGSRALQAGHRTTVLIEDDAWVYLRELDGQVAVVALNRGPGRTVSLSAPLPSGAYREVLTGQTRTFGGPTFTLELPSSGPAVWLPVP